MEFFVPAVTLTLATCILSSGVRTRNVRGAALRTDLRIDVRSQGAQMDGASQVGL